MQNQIALISVLGAKTECKSAQGLYFEAVMVVIEYKSTQRVYKSAKESASPDQRFHLLPLHSKLGRDRKSCMGIIIATNRSYTDHHLQGILQ